MLSGRQRGHERGGGLPDIRAAGAVTSTTGRACHCNKRIEWAVPAARAEETAEAGDRYSMRERFFLGIFLNLIGAAADGL